MIVVDVLMTSCHVSLNPNSGPRKAQATIEESANANASGWPPRRAAHAANRPKTPARLPAPAPLPAVAA